MTNQPTPQETMEFMIQEVCRHFELDNKPSIAKDLRKMYKDNCIMIEALEWHTGCKCVSCRSKAHQAISQVSTYPSTND